MLQWGFSELLLQGTDPKRSGCEYYCAEEEIDTKCFMLVAIWLDNKIIFYNIFPLVTSIEEKAESNWT